jgi:hypothetical protein
MEGRCRRYGGGPVRCLAHDLEFGVAGEHATETIADDGMVVDDEQPYRGHVSGAGRPAIAVPPPIAITLDLYSHVTPTMQRDAAAVLDAVLRR